MRAIWRRLISFIQRWNDLRYDVAGGLIGLGAAFYLPGGNSGWERGVGGLLAGSSLTVLITTVTAKEAVRQQNAKEANLRRKSEVYGPLHAELKSTRERHEAALVGDASYPLHIDTGQEPTSPVSILPRGYEAPLLGLWPVFKTDHHQEDLADLRRGVSMNFSLSPMHITNALMPHVSQLTRFLVGVLMWQSRI
jgi:hypothetical protein